MWGSRVVIPPEGRKAVLQQLHEGHPGTTRMKLLARMYVWCLVSTEMYKNMYRVVVTTIATVTATSRSTSAMEMAMKAMGKASYGLSRSFPRKNYFDCN